MTDLFANLPPRTNSRDVGKGNALFLADLDAGTPIDDLRANVRAGKYPNLWPRCAEWIAEAQIMRGGQ